MTGPDADTRIPLAVKLVVTAWLLVWVPVYWRGHGPQNFLWFCDLANFLIAGSLWIESRLIFSSQAVAVLLAQVLWVVDVLGRLLFGVHPIGGTEYMFDAATPLALRLMSLFHVGMLALLVWGTRRLGYDPRGLRLQLAIAAVILPVSWLFGPEHNLNWTWGPFGAVQEALPPLVYLLLLPLGYLVVLYLPSHWALSLWAPSRREPPR
jgi:hypothetical protein